jgi:hypothetical protein
MDDVLIPVPPAGRREGPGDRLGRPQHHPAGDIHQGTVAVRLDHPAQQQPGDGHQLRPASPAGPLRVAGHPGESGDVARQAIDADQGAQAPRGATDHAHDSHGQGQSRDGTAIAIQSRRATAFIWSSSAWTGPNSTWP